jgi:hypothetical protein
MPYPKFDLNRLRIEPLGERAHDMALDEVLALEAEVGPFPSEALAAVAERVAQAHQDGRPVIWMMGAHVIKQGLSRFVIDLMERGIVTHVAMNGACVIHDFELAMIGATTESVARYIRTGQFGMWRETGWINDAVREGAAHGIGIGEAVGRQILAMQMPHAEVSLLAAGIRCQVPVTVHVSIGQDIIHQHPNFDGAAYGATSHTDFLIFARAIEGLERGVFLNVGSAVMGPEVYLKALSMARNVAHQEERELRHFTTAVFDLLSLGDDLSREAPKTDPRYYYRPFKTILVRTVADGGESFYVQGDHRVTLPHLHRGVRERLAAGR